MHRLDSLSEKELVGQLEILQLESSAISEWHELARLPQIKTLIKYLQDKLTLVRDFYQSINSLNRETAPILLAANQATEAQIKSELAKILDNEKLKNSVDDDIKYGVQLLTQMRTVRKNVKRTIVSDRAITETGDQNG